MRVQKTSFRRLRQGLTLGIALAVMPASAYAVNVSSSDGSGSQQAIVTYNNGKEVGGLLRSTTGNAVYYQGRINWANCTDTTTGRYSTNVTTYIDQRRGGNIVGGFPASCTLQGVRSKICKVNSGLPDSCGAESLRY